MVELSAGLNITGLVFDIIGVILIFRFALPAGMIVEDRGIFEQEKGGGTAIKPASSYQRWARIGLGVLIFGFFLQAMGNAALFWK